VNCLFSVSFLPSGNRNLGVRRTAQQNIPLATSELAVMILMPTRSFSLQSLMWADFGLRDGFTNHRGDAKAVESDGNQSSQEVK
jgi:hypothetical protein